MSRSLIRRLSRLGSSSGTVPSSAPSNEALRSDDGVLAGIKPAPLKDVWLDCDPGHDDAIALLVALHDPRLNLIGVSTVSGNACGAHTFGNAARLLEMFQVGREGTTVSNASARREGTGAANPDAHLDKVPLFRGADEPLLKTPKADEEIHGEDGLGGVMGLPSTANQFVQRRMRHSSRTYDADVGGWLRFFSGILESRIASGQPRLHLVATGPLTNIALLLKVNPEVVKKGVEQIVIMGGAAGVRGNRGPLAEFNILCDPEAARIVFDFPIKVVMAGLNVTHQAIFTPALHDRLLHRHPEALESATPLSALRKMVSSTLTFFASTYASQFGFSSGPPVHDVLAVAYVADPTLFDAPSSKTPPRRYNVEVECAEGSAAVGATVVDFWGDRVRVEAGEEDGEESDRVGRSWGRGGRNVTVLEELDVEGLWDVVFNAVDRAEAHVAACEVRSG